MSARLQQLLGLLANAPTEPFLLFAIAKEYEGLKEEEKALHYYEQLRQESPEYVGLYYHLGKLLERLQQPDAALQAYDQGIQIAQKQNNRHAWSELREARLGLADDPDDDI